MSIPNIRCQIRMFGMTAAKRLEAKEYCWPWKYAKIWLISKSTNAIWAYPHTLESLVSNGENRRSLLGNCKVVPGPGLKFDFLRDRDRNRDWKKYLTGTRTGTGTKNFHTGPGQFFMQYILTFIILTWLKICKSDIFICYFYKSLYSLRVCLQESEFSNCTDFWIHIKQQHNTIYVNLIRSFFDHSFI